jgi:purine-binding chemotaxis protein CheW
MLKKKKYVIFWLDNQKFALHLSNVERVVRIVEVSPLSKTPKYIFGTINFQGEFLPVINLRILCDLNDRDIDLNDQLIITNTTKIKVALWVDCVSDIIEREDEEIIESDKILMKSKYNEGAFKFNDELVVIHDLDTFLNFNEKSLLKSINKKKVVNI